MISETLIVATMALRRLIRYHLYMDRLIFALTITLLVAPTLGAASLTRARQHKANAIAARQLERFADSSYFFNEAIAEAKAAGSQTFELECLEELIAMIFEYRKIAEGEDALRRLHQIQKNMQFSKQDQTKTKLLLGYSLLEQGRLGEAAQQLLQASRAAAKLPSQRSYARTLLGLLHHRKDQREKAEHHLRRGAARFLKDSPPKIDGMPNPVASLGAFYHLTKRPARAERALRKALEHDKKQNIDGSCRSYAELARFLLESKRDADAFPYIEKAIAQAEKSGKYVDYELICSMLFNFKRDARAIKFLEDRMNFFERRTNLMGMRRICLIFRAYGKYPQADKAFSRLLTVVKKHDPTLKTYLGLIVAEEYSIVLWHLGRQDEAQKLVGQVPALRHKTDKKDEQ